MKTIAIVAQKGGVGKTTLAVNLAVAAEVAGIPVALFDLDRQESAAMWADTRQEKLPRESKDKPPHVEYLTERRLEAAITAAREQGFAFALIDTPPNAGIEATTAVKLADLVLIPCAPSYIEIVAIRTTAQLVKSLNKPAFAVLNTAPASATNLLEDARTLIAQKGEGLSMAPVVLRERSAYRAAWPLGKGVVESEPDSKAAIEISALLDWVCSQLQLSKQQAAKKGRKAHG